MSEMVKKLVEEEGREARNLVMWNVLLDEKSQPEVLTSKKPPTLPRSVSPKPAMPGCVVESDQHSRKRCALFVNYKGRVRSSSVGRSPQDDLRARYWTILFENLHRAVDEIYQTCETDESVVECKEAIMMLENYSKEFRSLIQWLNLNKDFENTPPPNRPTSLAWEVRKSSPGKGLLWNAFLDRYLFHDKKQEKSVPSTRSTSIQTDLTNQTPCLTVPTEDKSIKTEVEMIDFGLGRIVYEDCIGASDKKKNANESIALPAKEAELISNTSDCSLLDDKNIISLKQNNGCCLGEAVSVDSKAIESTASSKLCDGVEVKEASQKLQEEKTTNTVQLNLNAESNCKPQLSANAAQPTTVDLQDITGKPSNKNTCSRPSASTILTHSVNKASSTTVSQNQRQPKTNLPSSVVSNRRKADIVSNTSVRRCLSGKGRDLYSAKAQPNCNAKTAASTYSHLSQPVNQTNTKSSSASVVNKQTVTTSQSLKKNENFHGSSSSLSSTSSGKSWADKVRGSVQELSKPLMKCAEERNTKDEDDSEGWETVRGRNRSRHSPAKKLGSSLQAKSYPDIHMKESSNQYGSTLSLKSSSQIKNNCSESTIKAKQQANSYSNQKNSNTFERKQMSYNAIKSSQQCGKTARTNQMKGSSLPSQYGDRKRKEVSQKPGNGKCANSAFTRMQPRTEKNKTVYKENSKCIKERINITQKMQIPTKCNKLTKFQISEHVSKSQVPESPSLLENTNTVKMENLDNKNAPMDSNQMRNIDLVTSIKNAKNLESAVSCSHSKEADGCIKQDFKDVTSTISLQENTKVNKTAEKDALSDSSDIDTISCNSCDLINANSSDDDSDCQEFKQQKDEADADDLDDRDLITCSDGQITPNPDMSGSEILEWDDIAAREEAQERIHKLGLSWADQMDHLDMELRPPGHALHMHEKLSSPFRKRSLSETIRRHEEKQIKAQEKRERLLEEKTQRFKDIAKKVEEMKAWKEQQQEKSLGKGFSGAR